MRYVVQHNYTAYRDGRLFGPWEAGTEVELDELDAEWVNRDSAGTLVSVDQADTTDSVPDPEPTPGPTPEAGTEVEVEGLPSTSDAELVVEPAGELAVEPVAAPRPRGRGKR